MDENGIDRQALAQNFVAEAADLLGQMEQDLVALEARPQDEEVLNALFRVAHTLKGSASLVGFDEVSEVAHAVEGLLERLRARSLPVTAPLVTLLLQSVDNLREAVAAAAAGKAASSPAGRSLRERLARATASGAESSPAAASHPEAEPQATTAPAARTLRVDLGKLDRLLDLAGEIGIARGRLTDMLERGASLSVEEILSAHRDADRLYLDLQDLIMKARMVPIGPTFNQHARTVRDLALAQGKQARLVVEGADAEVDTAVVEHIRDPLTHMVRNAIDHGIETPAARRERGKDPCGRLTLRAFHEAGSIVIEVVDDGAGLPRKRIAERAAALGLVPDASKVTEEEIGRLVLEPGLSTSDTVTEISGRGVGMDVVRRNVESLGGSVHVESEEGTGTKITLRLPLTLAIIQGFRVGVAGETFIFPLDAVVQCLELPRDERTSRDATGIVELGGRPLPYLRLREHFGIAGAPPQRENVVVVRDGGGGAVAGVAVDALHGESQTVIKPLGRMFQRLPGISGSSILGDGKVALILDVAGLLRETLKRVAANA